MAVDRTFPDKLWAKVTDTEAPPAAVEKDRETVPDEVTI
jgi:hypothetical protein